MLIILPTAIFRRPWAVSRRPGSPLDRLEIPCWLLDIQVKAILLLPPRFRLFCGCALISDDNVNIFQA